jgi:hypothetical protein
MSQAQDELILATLMSIKESAGGTHAEIRQIKDALEGNSQEHKDIQEQIRAFSDLAAKIPGYVQGVRDLEVKLDGRVNRLESDIGGRLENLESEVKGIREVDIPQFRESMAVQRWFASNRNKFLALLGVGILGAGGNALAGLVKENVKVTFNNASPEIPASSTTMTATTKTTSTTLTSSVPESKTRPEAKPDDQPFAGIPVLTDVFPVTDTSESDANTKP